jgi:nucleotide-binding universal stress UspA family protein
MKRILVPTDFSYNAEKALEYALHLGIHFSAEVYILHAWELPHQKSAMFVSTQELLKEKSENNLREIKEMIELRFPELKIKTISMMAETVSAIKSLAKKLGIDFIIMGTKGASGLKKIFMGSVTTDVIDDAPCAVMAIPADAEFKNIKKIGFATDLSSYKMEDIIKSIPLAQKFNSSIIITHVSAEEKEERSQFEEFIKCVKNISEYENISYSISKGNNVVKNLMNFIETENIDILILTRRKREFYESIFHTSISKEIAFSAKTPLIIYQS